MEFAELQLRLGWNYDDKLLQRVSILKPISTMTFDPMHVFYVQGLFNHNAGLLFKSLKAEKSSITYSRAREFVSLWTLPHAMSKFNVLPVLERGETHLSDSTLKCTASEGLTLTLIFVNSAICPPPPPPCTRPHTFPWPSFGQLSACRNMPKALGRRLKKRKRSGVPGPRWAADLV